MSLPDVFGLVHVAGTFGRPSLCFRLRVGLRFGSLRSTLAAVGSVPLANLQSLVKAASPVGLGVRCASIGAKAQSERGTQQAFYAFVSESDPSRAAADGLLLVAWPLFAPVDGSVPATFCMENQAPYSVYRLEWDHQELLLPNFRALCCAPAKMPIMLCLEPVSKVIRNNIQ